MLRSMLTVAVATVIVALSGLSADAGLFSRKSNCGGCACKCCPAIPEYPMVCMHDHRDMHRDLASRQHAPWW